MMRLHTYQIAFVYLLLCLDVILSLQLIHQWSQLDFQFPNDTERQKALSLNHFIPGASIPFDVFADRIDINGDGRIFVTIPRQNPGCAFTLTTVSSTSVNEPLLLPYPDYSWNANQGSNCDGLTSVFRVTGDECNRLWVADTGKIGFNEYCPPQLLAFDLATNKLLVRYRIPKDQLRERTLLINPIPDVQSFHNQCKDTFVYIADATGFGLIVFDLNNYRSWRIENKEFFPFPTFGTFTIAGESFDLMSGILGMAVFPRIPGKPADTLYFHSLASNVENTVSTNVLKNYRLFKNNSNAIPRAFQPIPGYRLTQSAPEDFDKLGRLYFGQNNPIALYRWDKTTPFNINNFERLAKNDETLQFLSGIKILEEYGTEVLWVLSNRFQKAMTRTLCPTEINFRLYRAFVNLF